MKIILITVKMLTFKNVPAEDRINPEIEVKKSFFSFDSHSRKRNTIQKKQAHQLIRYFVNFLD